MIKLQHSEHTFTNTKVRTVRHRLYLTTVDLNHNFANKLLLTSLTVFLQCFNPECLNPEYFHKHQHKYLLNTQTTLYLSRFGSQFLQKLV